jgi:hypothetical protein
MAFATDENLRLRFQLTDTDPALLAACIDEAHTQIVRLLDPRYDTATPPGALVLGETYLAGAAVLRALAAKEALDQKRLSVGGQRIEEGTRFQSLTAAAASAVERAWEHLEPFLLERPSLATIDATDTAPILGEE